MRTARLTATYLKELLQALSTDRMSTEMRNESHRLVRAVELNDLSLIEELVARIHELATSQGIPLPPAAIAHADGASPAPDPSPGDIHLTRSIH